MVSLPGKSVRVISQTSGTANSSVTAIVKTAKVSVLPITCPVNGSVNTSVKLANVSGRAWPGKPVRRLMTSTASVGMPMSSPRSASTPTLKMPPLVNAPRRRPIGIPAMRVSAAMLTCPPLPRQLEVWEGHDAVPQHHVLPRILAEPHHAAVLLGELIELLGAKLRVERHDVLALRVAIGGRTLDEHRGLALHLLPQRLRLGREQEHRHQLRLVRVLHPLQQAHVVLLGEDGPGRLDHRERRA